MLVENDLLFFVLEDYDLGKLSCKLSPLLQVEKAQFAQPSFPHRVSAPAPNHLGDPPLNLLHWKTHLPCHEAQILMYYSSYGHRSVETRTKILPFKSTADILIHITQDAVGLLSFQGTLLSCSACCLPQHTGSIQQRSSLSDSPVAKVSSYPNTGLYTDPCWFSLDFCWLILPACVCPYGKPVLDYVDCWCLTVMTDILVSSANPVRLLSIIDWSSLINTLKRTCIRIDICSIPLVTAL